MSVLLLNTENFLRSKIIAWRAAFGAITNNMALVLASNEDKCKKNCSLSTTSNGEMTHENSKNKNNER